jgi:hypothetical protein
MNIHLGFHFYGAGNIGDDLMLDGFLVAAEPFLRGARLTCAVPRGLESQKLRFPRVEWVAYTERNKNRFTEEADAWLGVGDTPFQMIFGDWFIRYLQKEVARCHSLHKPMYMAGVGADEEAKVRAKDIKEIASRITYLSTRDLQSHRFLASLCDGSHESIINGADLAHISLERIFRIREPTGGRNVQLGFMVNGDVLQGEDLRACSQFLRSWTGRVVFLANEVRSEKVFESGIFRRYVRPWYAPWRGHAIRFLCPDYRRWTISELVRHYRDCETVMSSRYHAVLAAAWAGCRVAVIARSSKLKNLASELDVPSADPPLTCEGLFRLYERAGTVRENMLRRLLERARSATGSVLSKIQARFT